MLRGLVLVAATLLVACGSDASSPSLERDILTEFAPPDIAATGAGSMLPTVTTLPHVATTSPVAAPTAAIVRQLLETRVSCGRHPDRCAFADVAVPGSPYDMALRTLMRERVEMGLRTVQGDGEYRPIVTSIEPAGVDEAAVTTCVFDALVLYDTKSVPGVHIVFDDHAVSIFSTWSIRLHEGRWKWFSEEVTRYAPNRNACS